MKQQNKKEKRAKTKKKNYIYKSEMMMKKQGREGEEGRKGVEAGDGGGGRAGRERGAGR